MSKINFDHRCKIFTGAISPMYGDGVDEQFNEWIDQHHNYEIIDIKLTMNEVMQAMLVYYKWNPTKKELESIDDSKLGSQYYDKKHGLTLPKYTPKYTKEGDTL